MHTHFYEFEPEVAGQLGAQTVMDTTTHPPVVSALEYQFDGWLGSDILTAFPCYIVTEPLYHRLHAAPLHGYTFDTVHVTRSTLFDDLYPQRSLPVFFWLKVHGQPHRDDMGVTEDGRLIISSATLALLREWNITHCAVHPAA